jgi:hypothetical protein
MVSDRNLEEGGMTNSVYSGKSVADAFRPGEFALRDTWFPMIHANQVGKRPKRRVVHGESVVFWQDDVGRIRAADQVPGLDRRFSPADEFTNGTGRYPVMVRYGYVWVWYGNPDNASPDLLPCIPHIPVDGMSRWFQSTVVYDCTYELVCENLLDLTHADFLHSKLTGDALSEEDVIEVESTSETVTMVRSARGRPIPQMQKLLARGAATQNVRAVTITYVRSGLCVLYGDFNPGMTMPMIHPTTPESKTRSRVPATFNPGNMPALGRLLFPLSAHPVGRQDNWAVQWQNLNYIDREDEKKDLSSRFDKAGLRYRKVYRQLVSRQLAGDYSYLPDAAIDRDTSRELGLNSRA